MNLFEYNLRNLFVLLIILIGIDFVLYKIFMNFITPNIPRKAIKTVIICISCVIYIFLGSFGIETNTKSQTVTVNDMVRVGSIGDFIVNYTFFVVDDNGNEMVYNTPILSSRKYVKKLENINQGERVTVQYGEKLNYLIDIEQEKT